MGTVCNFRRVSYLYENKNTSYLTTEKTRQYLYCKYIDLHSADQEYKSLLLRITAIWSVQCFNDTVLYTILTFDNLAINVSTPAKWFSQIINQPMKQKNLYGRNPHLIRDLSAAIRDSNVWTTLEFSPHSIKAKPQAKVIQYSAILTISKTWYF
jgi:hypothetical protein